jgi:hypothetical protein
MRIIEKEIVCKIKWNNNPVQYDQELSELCKDGQHFLVVNPALDGDVLQFIDIDIPLSDYCVKYKSGDTWIAKRFPPIWNGKTQIVQLLVKPKKITIDKYADLKSTAINDFMPKSYDLIYQHVWVYDKSLTGGAEVDAIAYDYVLPSQGKKIVGTAKTINMINNTFDVFFLSYKEANIESNWNRLSSICPRAQRIIGVEGILNAHKVAARASTTDMLYIIDADAFVSYNFDFEFIPYIQDRDKVYIWHSLNPVNGLEYGYGGVKLFPKHKLLEAQDGLVDISTSVGDLKVMKKVSCETRFNTDPFSTWKSAFRECAKLSSKIIKNQINSETEYRLAQWLTKGLDQPNGNYCIDGAFAGSQFGKNQEDMHLINDFNWLRKKFTESYPQLNIEL